MMLLYLELKGCYSGGEGSHEVQEEIETLGVGCELFVSLDLCRSEAI